MATLPKISARSFGKLTSARLPKLAVPSLPRRSSSRRGSRSVIGLDIEPGAVRAVQAGVSGGRLVVERAVSAALEPGVVRDGEVVDSVSLAQTLRDLFDEHKLDRYVRLGVANQQVVVRHLLLPPISDARELETAIRFVAGEELPMPVDQAVLDHVVLGPVETPEGARTRVLLVAARRSMIDPMLGTIIAAGLKPVGIDLSAFAMVRALRAPEAGVAVHVGLGGVVNLVATRGGECLFTRVLGGGIETLALELAERREVDVHRARAALAGARLAEMPALDGAPADADPTNDGLDAEAAKVLREGLRRLASEIRTSVDFHVPPGAAEPAGLEHVILTGSGAAIDGAAELLSEHLGVAVQTPDVEGIAPEDRGRYAVAAGLAVEEPV